ncbi:MAG: TIGR00268 family protein, partial [Pseudomonadota bacterium]
ALLKIADEEGCERVLDGTNADDAGDFRPGIRAAREKGVTSPLMEVGLAKEEIRILLKRKGLPVWNKPAQACLASRIPYGQDITEEKLKRIAVAEDSIRGLGFLTVRVRHWEHLAVVEVGQEELDRLFEQEMREKVKAAAKAAGYTRVAFDSDGYLSGSLNLTLSGPPE